MGQRLAGVGPFAVEAWGGEYTYTFSGLPELATDWCPFALEIAVPSDPTPADVDRLLERWHGYRPRFAADAGVFRDAVVSLYRACDEYGPRDLSDADTLAQVGRARLEVCTLDRRDHELYAAEYPEFDAEHGPLFAWDESAGWQRIA